MNLVNNNSFDIIVIGGGATGAGIALDASSRGLSVLLLEQNDFASGTSSKSSKLIHGGVRYLEKAIKQLDKEQFNLVKEGLYERALFIKNAPHLAKKLKLDTPIYNNFEIIYVYIGLLLYKLISGKKSIGSNTFINKTLLSLLQPSIKKKDLVGAVSFFDGRFIDSRMVIALLQSAQNYGAVVKNYSEVKEFIYDSEHKIKSLKYTNKITNEEFSVDASYIINATGANVDNIRLLDDDKAEEILSLSSGIHLILDKKFLPNDEGILIPQTSDGRVIFILPYLGKCLIGTSDEKTVYTKEPKASNEEIEYLLKHINEYFDIKIYKDDILSVWSGIRPLVKPLSNGHTEEIVREHKILNSDSGLISIAGGKWTTYRKMAEELIDYICEKGINKKVKKSKTKHLKVHGSRKNLKKIKKELEIHDKLSKQTKQSLLNLYGSEALGILSIAYVHNAFELIHKDLPFIKAEIIYCIKHEFSKKPIDFLARRISLCFIDKKKSLECLLMVCQTFKVQLLWSNDRFQNELNESKKLIEELF